MTSTIDTGLATVIAAQTRLSDVEGAKGELTIAGFRVEDIAPLASFEEMVFLGDEMLERTRTEMHLFTEFVAKMASAHSVRDVRTMCQECGQHQLDFLRRDSERLFRHGERMIAATSNLISGRSLN
jgi:citrate synthase